MANSGTTSGISSRFITAFNTRLDTPFWQTCRAETDLAGAVPFVQFYRENGPSLLGAPLLSPLNSFGVNGHLALLCGQQVPHGNPHQPDSAEEQIWRGRTAELAAEAKRGFSVEQALTAIRNTQWKWA